VAGGRQVFVKTRVTPEQHEALKQRAAELRVSVSKLMVDSALTPAGLTLPEQNALWSELEGIGRQLAAVGNNVNQIARHLNSGGAMRPGEVAGASDAVTRIAARLAAVLDELPAAPTGKAAPS
jgi:uncharacterized protein (DUF1778 family)